MTDQTLPGMVQLLLTQQNTLDIGQKTQVIAAEIQGDVKQLLPLTDLLLRPEDQQPELGTKLAESLAQLASALGQIRTAVAAQEQQSQQLAGMVTGIATTLDQMQQAQQHSLAVTEQLLRRLTALESAQQSLSEALFED